MRIIRFSWLLFWIAHAGCAQSGPVKFARHTINADARFEAAGVLDVNRDGKLDILSGGWWYEGPCWSRHFVREIKEIDEYHEDFCDLPYDVDGDGWTDTISVAYRGRSISWIRNPGKAGGQFEEVLIDQPGNMETAILADVNGDGKLDLLPHINITGESSWYELARDPAGPHGTKWIKHVVQAKGNYVHGIGAGDLNGDGRCDILRADGWWAQPAEPGGTWVFHQEWTAAGPTSQPSCDKYTDVVGRASIPMLVYDVDGDGDADVIYGMGHDFGLYWLEQQRNSVNKRCWSRHEIDGSWSQAHLVLLADLDGDGQPELLTGKRFRAHNGRDPGDNLPPRIYYYKFDRRGRKWRRFVIDESGVAGLGISTQAVDVDGDGDLDIVAPGKTGLYLFENLRK